MKKIILLLGILGLFIIPCKSQNLANSIERLLARDVATVKNTTNEVADSSFVIIDMGQYRSFSLDVKMLGGVTLTTFMTLDETLQENSCAGWVPFNENFIRGNGETITWTDSHLLLYSLGKFSPVKMMLRFVNSDNTNSCKVIVERHN